MSFPFMDILRILDTGGVQRFHAFPGITGNNLGHHQWGVAIIAEHIHPQGSKDMILRCLTHDCAERVTGDVPSMFKKEVNKSGHFWGRVEMDVEKAMGVPCPDLTTTEVSAIEYADSLEGMFYSLTRFQMGEKQALRCYHKWASAVAVKLSNETDFALQDRVEEILKGLHELKKTPEGFRYE